MREPKYRVWDKNKKKMYEVDALDFYTSKTKIFVLVHEKGESVYESHRHLEYPVECELIEYTGLKDKNGRGIYKGDIILWQGGAGTKEVVKFEYNYLDYLENRTTLTYEVIGNIMENPKLLKGEIK